MKRYPKYKDSGVPWLGQVPAHWEVKRVRHMAQVMPSNVDKKTVEGEAVVRLCNYTDVYYNERIVMNDDYMAASASDDQIAKFNLRVGDVVITKDSEEPDDIGVPACVYETAPDLVCGYHLAILRPFEPYYGRYLARSVSANASKAHFFVSAKGVTRFALGYHAIADMPLLVPPREEALAISDYIDSKLDEIDSAISSQERMIELLKERRSAIITQAVTKGLDPKAKMKDSGVPWLGQVPAHWEVKRLRHLGALTSSGIDKISKEGEQAVSMINFVDVFNSKTKRLKKGDFELMTTTAPADKASIHQVRRGDILITPSSEESSDIGRSALVDDDFSNTVYSYHLLRFSCTSRNVSPYFLSHVLNSTAALSQLSAVAQGTTRQTLSRGDIKDVCVGLPGIEEQLKIAAFLDQSISSFNHAISSQERMIELLKERRSAIITQAVTGQIDVR